MGLIEFDIYYSQKFPVPPKLSIFGHIAVYKTVGSKVSSKKSFIPVFSKSCPIWTKSMFPGFKKGGSRFWVSDFYCHLSFLPPSPPKKKINKKSKTTEVSHIFLMSISLASVFSPFF